MVSKDNKSEKGTVRESHKIKEKTVKNLAERIQKSKTFMIISIKSLPSPQFQSIKKGLRDYADIQDNARCYPE